jgi:hypothetical protein
MASAPFSTAARAHSQSPAGASSSGQSIPDREAEIFSPSSGVATVIDIAGKGKGYGCVGRLIYASKTGHKLHGGGHFATSWLGVMRDFANRGECRARAACAWPPGRIRGARAESSALQKIGPRSKVVHVFPIYSQRGASARSSILRHNLLWKN